MPRTWVGGFLLAVYALGTLYRLPAWASDLTLFRSAVKVTPTLPRPAVNLAGAYLRAQQWGEAEKAWTTAASLSFNDPQAQETLRTQLLLRVALAPSSSRSTP
jgi:hypothetical protein